MKTFSRWAARHASLAIVLIIVCEFVNGFNGVMLGATVLNDVPMALLQLGSVVLIGLAVGVRQLSRFSKGNFSFGRWCLFGAFLGNFLLFGLLGGSMVPRSRPQSAPFSAWGSRHIKTRLDTLVRPDTLRTARPARQPVVAAGADATDRETGKRVGYVLLFLLSIFLAFFTAGLACSIACSGQGFLALTVFFLGLGFPAGGAYLLGRLSSTPIKKASDMTRAERRRAGRVFWIVWGTLIGVFSILLLVAAAS